MLFAGSSIKPNSYVRQLARCSGTAKRPGQSGDLYSPHYNNPLERWQQVDYLPLRFSRKHPKERSAS